ncbi:hypothetical protein [Mycolicibacterium fortuitum]|uniref:hypothetical protein n=1 Tax=Mycolicibacterium fortuitum TaxID=1766 RepID=UPI000300486C|nr:hypothetical protein [Mycolicibacterium fortuitum]AIY44950.1 hypothetical protein G155_04500 [Mycobacterium sp. VKM Ac-1817D]WEV33701.1 hypothetical protein OMF10_04600 [Mycolicibacterium fortuitum]
MGLEVTGGGLTQERPGGRTGVPADGRTGPDQVDDRGHHVDPELARFQTQGRAEARRAQNVSNACRGAGYLTGQLIRVDGGASVSAA